MSDWEDDEWNSKPKMAASAPVRRSVQQDNDWDDGPSQTAKRNERHERSRSSRRDSDGSRSNNNYMDLSDGQGDQVTFTVSKSSVGSIIGRGGSKIKELESRFHVKLNIGELFISFKWVFLCCNKNRHHSHCLICHIILFFIKWRFFVVFGWIALFFA